MSISVELGKQVKRFRRECGLTQEELAERIGVESPSFVSKIETGRASPSYDLLGSLAVVFGIKIKDFFDLKSLDQAKASKRADKWEHKICAILKQLSERERKKAFHVLKALFTK